jgi:hypothetical protein
MPWEASWPSVPSLIDTNGRQLAEAGARHRQDVPPAAASAATRVARSSVRAYLPGIRVRDGHLTGGILKLDVGR